jgi:hypothetical protein
MKKIIIVGNGKSVLHKTNGRVIDKFEYVTRLNRFRIQGFEQHVGTKTNIICFSKPAFLEYIKPLNQLRAEFLFENKQLLQDLYFYYKQQKLDINLIKQNIQIVKSNNLFLPEIPLSTVTKLLFFPNSALNMSLDKTYKFIPNVKNFSTGTASILYFVEQNYDVTITGFDFFQKSSCYWLKSTDIFTENRLIVDRTTNDGHPYILEELVIKKLILSNKVKVL